MVSIKYLLEKRRGGASQLVARRALNLLHLYGRLIALELLQQRGQAAADALRAEVEADPHPEAVVEVARRREGARAGQLVRVGRTEAVPLVRPRPEGALTGASVDRAVAVSLPAALARCTLCEVADQLASRFENGQLRIAIDSLLGSVIVWIAFHVLNSAVAAFRGSTRWRWTQERHLLPRWLRLGLAASRRRRDRSWPGILRGFRNRLSLWVSALRV